MRFWTFLAVLCFVCAVPAAAQDVADKHAVAAGDVHSDLVRYGQWLVELNAATHDAMAEVQGLQAAWDEALRAGTIAEGAKQFRPRIARARAAILRAQAATRVISLPEFHALPLTPDLEPAALTQQMMALYDKLLQVVDSFDPMLQAMIANDGKAISAAGHRMMDTLNLLLDTQAVMAHAQVAAADPDRAEHESAMFTELFFRVASRMIRHAVEMMDSRPDASFAGDLDGLAARLDEVAARGIGRLQLEISTQEAAAAKAGPGMEAQAAILRKSVAVARLELENFAAARQLAAGLRSVAAKARRGTMSQAEFVGAMGLLRTTRHEMDRIVLAQNDILAQAK